jgi:hypothetical protein
MRRLEPSPKTLAAIVAAVEKGATLAAAAEANGISRSTLHKAQRRDPGFASALERARDSAPPKVKASKPATARPPKPAAPAAPLRQEREDRDTRPVVSADRILAGIVAAAHAIGPALTHPARPGGDPRFSRDASWPTIRAAFHSLADVPRREAIVRLVLEEQERIDRDRAASWSPAFTPANANGGA